MIGRLIESRHIDAFNAGKTAQRFQTREPLALACAHAFDEFHHHFLAVANLEGVDEGGKRLGIECTGAAGNDERIAFTALAGAQRNVGQIEHFQHVGIAHFVLQGEAHDIKMIHRRARLNGKERQILPAHGVGHIGPGHECALAQRPGALVDDMIQDFDAKMGHAHLIGIRKAKGKGDLGLIKGLADGIHFAARIARGFQNRVEQTFETFSGKLFHNASSKHNTSVFYHTIKDRFCPCLRARFLQRAFCMIWEEKHHVILMPDIDNGKTGM